MDEKIKLQIRDFDENNTKMTQNMILCSNLHILCSTPL